MWDRYKVQPSFVLGFHGCDASIAEQVFAGKADLKASTNAHDWLGSGIYFWESSPQRALEWAEDAIKQPASSKGRIKRPAVVGAIIDLRNCCTLFDSSALGELSTAYDLLKWSHDEAKTAMPRNKGVSADAVLRYLDCAVIEYMHALRDAEDLPPYDTVRAAFSEGDVLYPDARLTARNHIQLAVRNPQCIKGYFRPIVRS
jgi:hypothetical protein